MSVDKTKEYLLKTEEKQVDCLHETLPAYLTKRQGEYTLEDYYNLPEDYRAELIDGVLYDMASASSIHQLIAGLIYSKLLDHISRRKEQCVPFGTPLDVQLDCDNRTMVQPDVMLICDRDKLRKKNLYGAPDFAVEILSPSTRKKDATIKLEKYRKAGVREYWIVDTEHLQVIVYDFSVKNCPVIYGFDAKIPVSVLKNECVIDFQEIYDYVSFLYERDDDSVE